MRAVSELTDTNGPLVVDLGSAERSELSMLGARGRACAELARLGLPVPAGFVITAAACRGFVDNGDAPGGLWPEVERAVEALEERSGRRLGDPDHPLLLSVHADDGTPDLTETRVVGVGMTDAVVRTLADRGSGLFGWDTYCTLARTYGRAVLGIGPAHFEDAATRFGVHARGAGSPADLESLRALAEHLGVLVRELGGEDVPQDAMTQLRRAVDAVALSGTREDSPAWPSPRRESAGGVMVVELVSGTRGPRSGRGIAYSRNPATGSPGINGDYVPLAAGQDAVRSSPEAVGLAELRVLEPAVHAALQSHLATVEARLGDLSEIDFVVEQGRLWILSAGPAGSGPAAAFRVAAALVDEGLISLDTALERVDGGQLEALLRPAFAHDEKALPVVRGLAASTGAAIGQLALDTRTTLGWAALGLPVVVAETPSGVLDDPALRSAHAVISATGGLASRAAVVAREEGRPCVAGLRGMSVDTATRTLTLPNGIQLREGSVVSVDGGTGEVYEGARRTRRSPVAAALYGSAGSSEDSAASAVIRLLAHADRVRHLEVHANAETPEEARIARRLGAQGIGLCRTEHMLLGPRRELVERLVTGDERRGALAEIESLTLSGFTAILEAMDGLPVVVRLLDPPLHEFLPDLVDLSVRTALAEERGVVDERLIRRLVAVRRWRETNPTMGLRGVRILTVLPQIVDAQVRALAQATIGLQARGLTPRPRIMIPLVADVAELTAARTRVERIVDEVAAEHGVDLEVPVGVMIELPRAALTAAEMARSADFFSFGTNDLTQMSWGIFHDDAEATFLRAYRQEGILRYDPFDTIDEAGVGRLVRLAAEEGRRAKPGLGLGACGKHAEDPGSVGFFDRVGLDYLSCPPHRVPLIRLEAGRQALRRVAADPTGAPPPSEENRR